MENQTEETFEQQGIAGKEIYLHDCQLMALLLDPRTKGNTSILSHTRWNNARLLLRKENIDIYTTIKLSEYMQLKEEMKA